MYNMSVGNGSGEGLDEKLVQYNVDRTDYLMYELALSVVDAPNSNGKYGTYTNSEKEEAINQLNLSSDVATQLWYLAGGTDKNNPYK